MLAGFFDPPRLTNPLRERARPGLPCASLALEELTTMSRLAIFLPLLLCLASIHAVRTASAADVPHILYVTADDLGWKDVGYHGSTIRTPTIDRLAKEGARLESFYVQPFSSQTRAAVMTGRYPMRYGLQTMQIQWFSDFGLPDDERILPQALKSAGYRTAVHRRRSSSARKRAGAVVRRGRYQWRGYAGLSGDEGCLPRSGRRHSRLVRDLARHNRAAQGA